MIGLPQLVRKDLIYLSGPRSLLQKTAIISQQRETKGMPKQDEEWFEHW